mmetsp:Transcript_68199/g.199533  ORF Transcript_68199/g.199533 Transcript_68199/m.199533 type:complete len:448 (-) Transcript_68199:218-1561(-)
MIPAATAASARDHVSRLTSTEYLQIQESEEEGTATSSSPCWKSYTDAQHAVRTVMDDPESGGTAKTLHYVVVVVIAVSTLHAIIQTVGEISEEYEKELWLLETIFTGCFTLEILMRMWISHTCADYFCHLSNAVDILATLPWYLELLMTNSSLSGHMDRVAGSMRTLRMVRLVRMVRLLRILRLAKAARHSDTMSTVFESIWDSLEGIFVLVFLVGSSAVVSATIIYAIESEEEDGAFASIPAAMWWSMATITTVGYGDVVPGTVPGKAVACLTMVFGTIIVAVSVAAITTSFTDSYNKRMNVAKIAKSIKKAKLPPASSGAASNRAVTEDAETERNSVSSSMTTRERHQMDLASTFARLEEEMKDALVRLECMIELVHASEVDATSSMVAHTASMAPPPKREYAELAFHVLQEQSHTLFRSVMSFVERLADAKADQRVSAVCSPRT